MAENDDHYLFQNAGFTKGSAYECKRMVNENFAFSHIQYLKLCTQYIVCLYLAINSQVTLFSNGKNPESLCKSFSTSKELF